MATYDLLDSVTLGTSAASVTFSSIDQSYRDLVLVVSGTMGAAADIDTRFNSDAGSNYPKVRMYGNGSGTSSQTLNHGGARFTFGTQVNSAILQIMDYTATDKHKPVLLRNNWTGTWVEASAIRWANTAAITSIDIVATSSSFNTGSTFYLYGVAA